jgi:hypothetical protein
MPADTPANAPVDELIVATVVLLLLHVPAFTVLLNVVVLPVQTLAGPVMGAYGFTVTTVVARQPAEVVYEMVAVPAMPPVTMPELIPIAATAVLLLVHEPPGITLLNVAVLQMDVDPVIGATGLTVVINVVTQAAGVV